MHTPVTKKGLCWIPQLGADCQDQNELFSQKLSRSSRQPCSGMWVKRWPPLQWGWVLKFCSADLSGSMVVQPWAQLTSFGTVWFGQIWVGNSIGYFDNKGSSSALAVVEDVRGNGYAHTHGEMVSVKTGPSTSSKKTWLLGAQGTL